MKDIVIKGKDVRRELYVWLICFLLACLVNMTAILVYDRPWIEMVSQIGYVFFISVAIYALQAFVRIVIFIALRLFSK